MLRTIKTTLGRLANPSARGAEVAFRIGSQIFTIFRILMMFFLSFKRCCELSLKKPDQLISMKSNIKEWIQLILSKPHCQ